jgi:hypothetical protein
MKKTKLTLALVLVLGSVVPQIGPAQTPAGGKNTDAKAAPAEPAPVKLADDVPTRYTVVKGDTLWGISGKFLKEPWRWPEIWNMNREQIKDPHWIYPGDVVVLSFDSNGKPLLSLLQGGRETISGGPGKLVPRIRVEDTTNAIPSIPARAIGPFLTQPLVIEAGELDSAPRIVAAEEGRVVVGAGNTAYAAGIRPDDGLRWQVYRPGSALKDPITGEVLGYEALYLGEAKVTRFGEGSSLEILKATQEINKGDRLKPSTEAAIPHYSPHAPATQVKGSVVSVLGGVGESAQYSIISLSVGKREGIEVGNVLVSMRRGETVSTKEDGFSLSSLIPDAWRNRGDGKRIPDKVKLPDERNGLIFVFRVFDKVSYGLVMSSRLPIVVGDVVQSP